MGRTMVGLLCVGLGVLTLEAGAVAQPAPAEGAAKPLQGDAKGGYVRVEGGEFTLGSPPEEAGRGNNETQHVVKVSPFFVKTTEVTQGEWQAVMGNNPSRFANCGPNCPVEQVNWYEAMLYLNKLTESEGGLACYTMEGCTGTPGGGCNVDWPGHKFCEGDYVCKRVSWRPACAGYRLPTEAEWEVAARAGTTTSTPAGDAVYVDENHAPVLDAIAVYGGNSGVSYANGFACDDWDPRQYLDAAFCGTSKVASKEPNGLGVHDMLGNVAEWTWESYQHDARTKLELMADYTIDGPGSQHAVRGHSWGPTATSCRVGYRNAFKAGTRTTAIGFRPVRSAP